MKAKLVNEILESSENKQYIKDRIDNMSYEEMLKLWRFAPVGDPIFLGEIGDYFKESMFNKKKKLSDEDRVRASKNLGWKNVRENLQVPFSNRDKNRPITGRYPLSNLNYENADKPDEKISAEELNKKINYLKNQIRRCINKHGTEHFCKNRIKRLKKLESYLVKIIK